MTEKCKIEKERAACPYCDKETVKASLPFCEPCQKTVVYCAKCHQPLPGNKTVCPKCGTRVK